MKLPFELLAPFTGSKIWVVQSNDKTLEDLSGIICGETRNSLEIKTSNGRKRVLKRACDFIIELNGQKWLIKGEALENRLKSKRR
ncbi:MAG: hypothetical protein GWO20_08185 [Candidatus Korarchaeota archaeon]|nr:hypothetical protein [Candidatus Korarchaeota archaeon]NIU84449.1 hypothetical protein [Candidatus Thorarchaeota archaeon]NIW12932.1 hypothetical protein [Candidatus Thorarchaeota archaeon]NIW51896.1 hypothetical protein [Candidatus Korarchaeota archaeon]